MRTFTIAIDGPSAAGKSTLANALSKRLNDIEGGCQYLDTGALFRALAYHFSLFGILPDENGYTDAGLLKIENMLPDVSIEIKYVVSENEVFTFGPLPDPHVFVNDSDVTSSIRTPNVTMYTSQIAKLPIIREWVLDFETDYASRYNVVMEGRDIGTCVLKNADVKFFITATPEIRAKRRMEEFLEQGEKVDYNEILKDIIERDKQDSEREISPMKPAEGAVVIDTTNADLLSTVTRLYTISNAYYKDYQKEIQKERDVREKNRQELKASSEETKSETE